MALRRSDLPSPRGRRGEEQMTSFAGEVREVYREFRDAILAKHRAGAGGIETTKAYSAGVEVIVEHLYDSLLDMVEFGPRRVPAIMAIGGFGRRELSPGSDVDLLLLWSKKSGHDPSVFAGYLVRMMWDAGLRLGHSVRTLAELHKALRIDLDLKTGLLDARWICGDEELREKLAAIKDEITERDSGGLMVAKLDEARRRWRKYGWSYNLIEPNIKESPGGLRDFQTIRWVGMALPWEGTMQGLHRLGIVEQGEIRDILRSFDFIVRSRNELHFCTQSAWDVLTVELQRSVASGLGYRREGPLLAVENFMRDYYSMSRSIYKVLERILEGTRGKGALRIIDGALYRRVGTRGLGQLDLRLRTDKLDADPIFMFKEQLRSGRRLSPQLERRIETAFKKDRPAARVVQRMRASFIELLRMPGRKAPVIRSMHELGVLRHIFPPFERLTCLKRYDLYHQYTADEHSLQAITHLEDVSEGDGLLPRIYNEVAEKVELLLATLLHDIGKSRVSGHERAGARMADEILRSFPIPPKSRSLVSFLIRNHLLLSHFSQRRDMEDRDTSLQFIRKIKNHLNLKMLYLLTYADLRATGSGVWTGWKENLLEDLYFKASKMLAERSDLTVAYSTILEKRRERILAVCTEPGERERMESHIGGMPVRYTMIVSPAGARMHLGMIDALHGRLAVTQLRRLRHSIELTICTRDRPFRLSQLCGVITINDLNILGAYAFTRSDGVVIDLFHVEGVESRLSLSSESRNTFTKELNAVLGGKRDLEEAYAAHVKRWKRRAAAGIPVPCIVEFENDLSSENTIIDITARDRPGLLYRITHILSEEGIDIQSAQITTRGGMIADSFYVKTSEGAKLSDVTRMRSIRRRLMARLDEKVVS